MFDISEAGAAAYNWVTGKIKGVDTADVVLGGVNGEANQAVTDLALRSANLNIRLAAVEQLLVNDTDTIINNLKDILDAFSGETEQVALVSLLAKKACNVTTTGDKATWVAALEIAKRTFNLNSTEKASWVTGLGIPSLINTEVVAKIADFQVKLDNDEFNKIIWAFNQLYNNPQIQNSINLSGGVNNLNLNIPNWKSVLGIGYETVRVGSTYIGDILTDKLVSCFFSALPSGTSYCVVGSLVGITAGATGWDIDNDVMWIVRDKTLSSFKVAIKEEATNTQNLWFEWALIKW